MDEAVIGGARPDDVLGRCQFAAAVAPPFHQPWMLGVGIGPGQGRQSDPPVEQVVIRLARDEGAVRQEEADRQAERCVVAAGLRRAERGQPGAGGVRRRVVHHLVARLAAPRGGDAERGVGFRIGVRRRRSLRAGEHAEVLPRRAQPVRRAVAGVALAEAVKLVRPHRVHPPDEDGAVSGRAQRMGVGRQVRGELVLQRPAALLVRPAAGEQRHAARRADRRGAIGGPEGDAGRRDTVDVRRRRKRVAIAPGDVSGVLVGEEKQDVGTRRHARFPSSVRRWRACGRAPCRRR